MNVTMRVYGFVVCNLGDSLHSKIFDTMIATLDLCRNSQNDDCPNLKWLFYFRFCRQWQTCSQFFFCFSWSKIRRTLIEFSYQCFANFRNQARCPNDQTPLSANQLFQDRSARREVLDLKVVCSNKDCSFVSELRNIQVRS